MHRVGGRLVNILLLVNKASTSEPGVRLRIAHGPGIQHDSKHNRKNRYHDYHDYADYSGAFGS